MPHTGENDFRSVWKSAWRAGPGSASFWGMVLILLGGIWLVVALIPFVVSFLIPLLLVYVGYKLITKSW